MPRDYNRRSHSRSASRSRSRTRSRSRNRSRSRSRSRSNDRYRERARSYEREEMDECRLHIADLTEKVSQSDLEKSFGKYGDLKEVWMAKNPPCFAFVVFKNRDDALAALKEMDQKAVGPCRIRVTVAKPRSRGSNRMRKRWDPSMKCYQCGRPGHFSRDCESNRNGRYRARRSYSRDRRDRRYSRSRSRDRRSRSYSRKRSRSRSLRRDH